MKVAHTKEPRPNTIRLYARKQPIPATMLTSIRTKQPTRCTVVKSADTATISSVPLRRS